MLESVCSHPDFSVYQPLNFDSAYETPFVILVKFGVTKQL